MYPDYTSITYVDRLDKLQKATHFITDCAETHHMIAIDCETTGLETRTNTLRLITIATPDRAFLFQPELFIDVELHALLINEGVTKIAHNAPFDWSYLNKEFRMGFDGPWPLWDTARAYKAVRGEYRSLGALAQELLGVHLKKELATSFAEKKKPTIEQMQYAATDALILWPLFLSLNLKGYNDGFLKDTDLYPMRNYLSDLSSFPRREDGYPSLRQTETGVKPEV